MRIGINALSLSIHKAGIGTYAKHLIDELCTTFTGYEYIIFIPNSVRNDFEGLPENVTIVSLPIINLPVRIFFEQFVIPFLVPFYKIDVLHSFANVLPLMVFAPQVVTIHDIYFVHDKKRFGFLKNLYLRTMVPLSARKARKIISVSHCTKNDLEDFFNIPSAKIHVIYHGYEQDVSFDTSLEPEVLKVMGITSSFYLFVGTIEPGKNLLNLAKAFTPLSSKKQLVIAGKFGWGFKDLIDYIDDEKLEEKIRIPGYVKLEYMPILYHNALALILPSFHEGFGMPIIEANNWGCPVCCSNTSCLPEIAADSALYFDPSDIPDIRKSMTDVENPKIRKMLIEKGQNNRKRFSWVDNAKTTLRIYGECGKKKRQ